MKTTFTAQKLWLAVLTALAMIATGCAKNNDNQGGNGYPGGGYYGYPGSGGGYAPGQPLTTTPVAGIYRSQSSGFMVSMQLNFLAGTAPGVPGQVTGTVMLNAQDPVCGIPAGQYPINQGQVIVSGNDFKTVDGSLSISTPMGVIQVQLDSDILHDTAGQPPVVDPFTGQSMGYYLQGKTVIQYGVCAGQRDLGWPLDR
jgi:hypothetical protein